MLKWMKMMRLIKSGSPITSERDARAQSSLSQEPMKWFPPKR